MGGGQAIADARNDLRHVGFAVAVGKHDDPAACILAQDLIGAVGLAYVGDLARRN